FDAFVIIDADTVVSANLLAVLSDYLAAGQTVIQAYYTVLPLAGSRAERLRQAALALVHYLRPAAKTALGASCGLKGNGMCFARAVIARFGWPTCGLAEDVEFHLQLVAQGVRVAFAQDAVVMAEMPASLRGAQTQNARWERGRLATIRGSALPLLGAGLARRDRVALDAGIEQLVPPLSVAIGASLLLAALALALHATLLALSLATALAVIAAYVVEGLVLARMPWRVWLALANAPTYIAWKGLLYGRVLLGRRETAWIRTARHGMTPSARDAASIEGRAAAPDGSPH
ncbi:MAG TPA: glycosyltransferase family 2 protein, partial [Dehalococcoidia bacterium]|nr:glycosyltransferase family 2 protein [Dehalococcoidia bacterium]